MQTFLPSVNELPAFPLVYPVHVLLQPETQCLVPLRHEVVRIEFDAIVCVRKDWQFSEDRDEDGKVGETCVMNVSSIVVQRDGISTDPSRLQQRVRSLLWGANISVLRYLPLS